jgi:uncharacterized protein (DUF1684 family)
MTISRWQERLEMIRKGKDRFFREHSQSPLPAQERERFKGLNYYPIDPSYRFEVDLHEHDERRTLRLDATHGGERVVLLRGEFRFTIGDQECTLRAFQIDPTVNRLFVPFRDATAGVETYDKGRYLDLEPVTHRTPEGKWILDFNEAYNPWCEYSEEYVCPFAPPENWLSVPVPAGERRYAQQ